MKWFFMLCLLLFSCASSAPVEHATMDFTIHQTQEYEWIIANGKIINDTNERFNKLITNHKFTKPTVVVFNSVGGDLVESMKLGNQIRLNGFITAIGTWNNNTITQGICQSACAYAFLGGTRRIVPNKSVYSIHQFYDSSYINPDVIKYTATNTIINQKVYNDLLRYIVDMNVNPMLLAVASDVTPWDNTKDLNRRDLARFRIVTE